MNWPWIPLSCRYYDKLRYEDTNKFITFGNSISAVNRSFVVVCEFSFDDTLTIVPTLQEAYDFIDMEEIERQLN